MKRLKMFVALNIMLAAFASASFGQVFEAGISCDACDDASPRFVVSLYPAGTYGASEPNGYPCPGSGFAVFYGMADDGAGNWSGSGTFALYAAGSPCITNEVIPPIFSIHCADATITAKRAPAPNAATCPSAAEVWNEAVISGVNAIDGQRFEARLAPGAWRLIPIGGCALWVPTISVNPSVSTLHQNPPLEPSVEEPVKAKKEKKSIGAMKDALRK